ncbi:UNVERIFIED_CONTAM: hypothetical protein K2H54_009893 [Gekko kuhli]
MSRSFPEMPWQSQDSEEYEAEGQLRFWNPDDLNASPNSSPTQDWIEEKLCAVCENLGISRDGHLSREKLVSICEQYGLQNIDTQVPAGTPIRPLESGWVAWLLPPNRSWPLAGDFL